MGASGEASGVTPGGREGLQCRSARLVPPLVWTRMRSCANYACAALRSQDPTDGTTCYRGTPPQRQTCAHPDSQADSPCLSHSSRSSSFSRRAARRQPRPRPPSEAASVAPSALSQHGTQRERRAHRHACTDPRRRVQVLVGDEQYVTVTLVEEWAGTDQIEPAAGNIFMTVKIRIDAITTTSFDALDSLKDRRRQRLHPAPGKVASPLQPERYGARALLRGLRDLRDPGWH